MLVVESEHPDVSVLNGVSLALLSIKDNVDAFQDFLQKTSRNTTDMLGEEGNINSNDL